MKTSTDKRPSTTPTAPPTAPLRLTKQVHQVKRAESRLVSKLGKVESRSGKAKRKVISKPKGSIGSVKDYGTPYNALNSQLLKFQPSETQAALVAWSHTVANPRTMNPHPTPVIAAPGASASIPRMYQYTIHGTATANAVGFLAIGANADAWVDSGAYGPVGAPIPENRYLRLPTNFVAGTTLSFPVHATAATYNGSFVPGGYSYPAYSATGAIPGIQMYSQPDDFVPRATINTRYSLVSVELRARPDSAALYESGELMAFNFRTSPGNTQYPSYLANGTANAVATCLALPPDFLSRTRVACPNWPSEKWISAVAVPNTPTCFGQWLPLAPNATADGVRVGYPSVFILGSNLPVGGTIEFEATYNYAVYGEQSFEMNTGQASESIQVEAGRAAQVVSNGMRTLIVPRLGTEKPHAGGIAAAVKAEQTDGRMPDTKTVIAGFKAAKDVVEAVTGTDIATEIAEIIGGIGAMLL